MAMTTMTTMAVLIIIMENTHIAYLGNKGLRDLGLRDALGLAEAGSRASSLV